MINVNATGCGKGKSFHNQQLIKSDLTKKFLVIVPSIALANEYNSLGRVIHSENTANVKSEIYEQIINNRRVLIITQQAFLLFPNKPALCADRHVIQDEQFEVFGFKKFRLDTHSEWVDMFTITPNTLDNWYDVNLNNARIQEFLETEDIIDNKTFIKDLNATPQLLYTNDPTMTGDSLLFSVISPEIYAGAVSVTISCSNFAATRQYALWLNLFNTEFNFTHEFVRYDTPNLTVHSAMQAVNSKTFNKKSPSIRDEFKKYVNEMATDPVYVDNNDYKNELGWNRVKHNCHGINEFNDKAHIVIMSAINYGNNAIGFLQQIGSMTTAQIRNSLIGEIAHQVVMRGTLRGRNINGTYVCGNANKCDVYVMEKDLATYLCNEIFNNASHEYIFGTGRPDRDLALTGTQRNKGSAIRRIHPEYNSIDKWPTHRLMENEIWTQTNGRGEFTKKYIEEMKQKLKELNK